MFYENFILRLSDDLNFKNFLQSGMTRVVVTVTPGFETAVLHYMATGQIWNGGSIPVADDPLYRSIVDELKEQEYMVEETWKTVLPTNLVALQRGGVAVAEDGLPCSCPEVDALNRVLQNNSATLTLPSK